MKLEDQVCSLELAKKLKKLGVNQESLWYWHFNEKHCPDDHINLHKDGNNCSAFTVAELGEMLPKASSYKHEDYSWCSLFVNEEPAYMAHREYDETEANARAKMLTYLLENKLIEITHAE